MTRRDLLRLTGSSLLYTGLSPLMGLAAKPAKPGERRLFFSVEDLPTIQANTRTPLLNPLYSKWAEVEPAELSRALDKFEKTGEIVRDFAAVLRELAHSAMVQLADPSTDRERSIIDGLERLIARPYWDYFRDGGAEVIGIQRASYATVRILFAREVLGDAIRPDLEARLMQAIADKGVQACYNTVFDMEHPETVKGWDFDEQHAGFYDITMERWPMILGANNLRAAPTGALGLGALALQGMDSRAEKWLQLAVKSTERFLKLFSPDGSYFEGLSYLQYSLRTTLPFIRAHQQLIGDVDWLSKVNLDGVLEYIMTMQMGKTPDGMPDIVNFSDARGSVFPGGISLIGEYTGNPLAGYAAKEAGKPEFIYDFLWYRPDAPAKPPAKRLLNKRNDLNWIICRSGWKPEDSVVAFKSGGPANHEHADRNHITFKAYGERLLNDHFGASYDRRNPGWKMRFTRGHNAVLLDGKGHRYLEGLEGTNDSKAYATILDYQDHGDHVWWTSDASAAYILDNYHAHQVLRSVLYAKPDILVVIDQIRFRYRPQTVDARFYPDNADGKAKLEVNGDRFVLSRPGATLHGLVASDSSATPRKSRLEVPAETGDFPCIEVHSPEGLTHHIITLLAASPESRPGTPEMDVKRDNNKWSIKVNDLRATVETTTHQPKFTIL